jgi:hypothetical protein
MGCAVFAICPPDTELANILEDTKTGAAAESWAPDVLMQRLGQVLDQAKEQSRERRQAVAAPLMEAEFSLDPLVDAVLGNGA